MPRFLTISPKRIYLARHGQSTANLNKQISGQLDVPLSDQGKAQSLWLRDVLSHEQLSAIYTSNLGRAVETARPTADFHKLPIEPLDGLNEKHFGRLQGTTFNDAANEISAVRHEHATRKALSGESGESYPEFAQRVSRCLDRVLHGSSGTILIVGHRNTNEVILAELLALGSAAELNINIKNKYVYEIVPGAKPQVATIRLGGEHHGKKFAGLKDD
jgi:broad specificity phosphatase PhoE